MSAKQFLKDVGTWGALHTLLVSVSLASVGLYYLNEFLFPRVEAAKLENRVGVLESKVESNETEHLVRDRQIFDTLSNIHRDVGILMDRDSRKLASPDHR